ncbi:cache domain-containing sensor histidine kinase [Alkalicoccobacillus porphyridii]|uniref:histidine kinase n=1 Tax=Alkalicoccobacillus porphyridii TaxID=2597270 RepID=A0A553ZYT0_9BACI|nr:sensor histidine kinase [Alkalicoccobacillus porphyridii]TSB46601.1 sensor histidine kinase [Alkalicoccobacillus porphyridii]
MAHRVKARLLKWINHLKLRDKLMLTFIVVVLIPISLVGLMLTQELRSIALDDMNQQSQSNIERVKERTYDLLKIPTFISNSLEFDNELDELVNTTYNTTFEVVSSYYYYQNFQSYLYTQREINSIRFYIDNPTLINNWEFIPVNDELREESWFQQVEDEVGYNQWRLLSDETNNNQKYLSLIKRINFLENQTYGIVVITIEPSQLNAILNQESLLTFITDEEGHVISSNKKEFTGEVLSNFIEQAVLDESGIHDAAFQGEQAQVTVEQLNPMMSQSELNIVSVSLNSQIVERANRLGFTGIMITLVGVTVAVVLIAVFSKLLSQRLSNLSQKIERVAAGDLTTKITIDGTDEIGQLSHQFNDMVENLKGLVEQVLETNRQKNLIEVTQNEMKFKMLASQINPHFLFNTLESIRMKAHIEQEKEIANVVKQLGMIIRKSLDTDGKPVPLRDEIELVQTYLEIQSFRYGERLRYQLNVAPETKHLLIQPLTIQPIVENAVFHGLETKDTGGEVIVSAYFQESEVIISVKDNGVGISENRLNSIQEMLDEKETNGHNRIGLRNVHQRLQLMYGSQAGLKITSEEGKGTHIQFSIPWEGT